MILCVTGLSGAGKTTIVNSLIPKLIKQGRRVMHINSDMVANKIFVWKYGQDEDRDLDYESYELTTIYSSMFLIIENVLRQSPNTVVITDGMYRKNSQRIKLEAIALKLELPFVLLRVSVDAETAKKRIEKRFDEEGFGGWVNPDEYEDTSPSCLTINNNGNPYDLEIEVDKLVGKLSSFEKIPANFVGII